MRESEFHDIVDAIYNQLEEIIDDSGEDIDYESSGGVLSFTCENNGSKIILSRQPSTAEIWVAAKSGGFHFRYANHQWVCATGETFTELLTRVFQEQAWVVLNFSAIEEH